MLSDDVAGLDERFAGAVATYTTPKGLRALIDRLLADPSERAAMGERGRAAILEEGLFRSRLDALIPELERVRGARR